MKKFVWLSVMLVFMGCASTTMAPKTQSGKMPRDGELMFPQNYQSFSTFLHGIQKPNAVRDLYINNIGAKAHQGESFANGSILVMEIYNAKKGPGDTFEKDGQGNLIEDGLAKVYVMQKGKGWGQQAPQGLRNGDWIYSAFKPNGERLKVDYTTCRGCHMPLGDAKDYVHRYDEYFEKRAHMH